MNLLVNLSDTQLKLLIGVIVCVVLLILLIVIFVVVKKKKKTIKVKDGVRYTTENKENEKAKVVFNVGDVLLKQGVLYASSKEGPLLPGKYTVKSADSNQKNFNIRLNGIVKLFEDNSEIVLAENDQVEPLNGNVIFK